MNLQSHSLKRIKLYEYLRGIALKVMLLLMTVEILGAGLMFYQYKTQETSRSLKAEYGKLLQEESRLESELSELTTVADEVVVSEAQKVRIEDLMYDISRTLPEGVSLYEISGSTNIVIKAISDSIPKLGFLSKGLEEKEYVDKVSMGDIQQMNYADMTYYATEVIITLGGSYVE